MGRGTRCRFKLIRNTTTHYDSLLSLQSDIVVSKLFFFES